MSFLQKRNRKIGSASNEAEILLLNKKIDALLAAQPAAAAPADWRQEILADTGQPTAVAELDLATYVDQHLEAMLQEQAQEKQASEATFSTKKERKQAARKLKKVKKQQGRQNKRNKLPQSSQDTLAYRQMGKDGLCQLDKNTWSITLQYQDINYQLAKPEDQQAIFEQYCTLINQFDSSVQVQMSFVNHHTKAVALQESLLLEEQDDDWNDLRRERNEMLMQAATQGNNNIEKNKYITLTLKADSRETAQQKLNRIEAETKNSLKALGCRVDNLDGYDRLKLLHSCLNKENQSFWFNWDLLVKTGLSTKDFIAPVSFDFRNNSYFKMGDTYGAVSYLQILAPELSDEILARLLGLDCELLLSLHLNSVDQNLAMTQVKRKIAALEKQKIEEQRQAVKSGYDMDILPPDLITYIEEAKGLLDDLQSRNERMFIATVLITNFAADLDALKNDIFQLESVAQSFNCPLKRLDFQQEDGLISSLPLGLNRVQVNRTLTTSSTAIFMPFTTQELFQEQGIYYGLNALSNNLIVADRKRLKNPKGLYHKGTGTPRKTQAKPPFTALMGEYTPTKGATISLYQQLNRRSTECGNKKQAELKTTSNSLCA